ncbi:TonB-dependent receptor [Candidatus Aminicenantes bacterium AC-334-K16]|jgi:outer membrane receptor protein involved in Fe transport|nr:TonB-dependent receptor [Candidatus Aminicenantes bacterium AC-334-K16]
MSQFRFKRSFFSFLALLFIFTLLIPSFLFPGNSATIKGRVLDLYGQPIAGALVEIKELNLKVRSDEQGIFVLENLAPGKYKIIFSHPHFMPGLLTLDIKAGEGRWVEFGLKAKTPKLLTLREEVTVVAKADSVIDVSLPSHRTIIPQTVLSELGTANLAESVERSPGVAMVGKGGYSMVPSIRGVAEHRVLLLIDGARIVSERRIGASASFISLNNIDRIEINRGPYSVYYGSGAIGGIINVITKNPPDVQTWNGTLLAGYNTSRKEKTASFSLSGNLGGVGLLLAANGKKADDYSSPNGLVEQSRYSDWDFLIKLKQQTKNSEWFLTLLDYWGKDIGKPSPSAHLKPRWYPKERNTIINFGYTRKNILSLDQLSVGFYLFPSELETKKENLRNDLSVAKRALAKVEGTSFGFKIRAGKNVLDHHQLSFGLDYFGRRGLRDSQQTWKFDSAGQIISFTETTSLEKGSRDNLGFYIDDKIQFNSHFSLNLGARVDLIQTSNFIAGGQKTSRQDESFSAYLGSTIQITPRLSFLANIGRSFRFPTISELFYTGLTGRGTVFGNPDLQPEKSLNMEAGLRYLHPDFFISVYGFHNRIMDMIQKYPGEGEDYFYRNLAEGLISGIEGELAFWGIKDIELLLTFHHLVGREKETNAPLNYIPPDRLVGGVRYTPGRFWIEPRITWSAAKDDPGPLEIEINGFTLVDLVFGWKLNSHCNLIIIGQNLTDTVYRFSADEKGVDAPGRGAVVRFSYSF